MDAAEFYSCTARIHEEEGVWFIQILDYFCRFMHDFLRIKLAGAPGLFIYSHSMINVALSYRFTQKIHSVTTNP